MLMLIGWRNTPTPFFCPLLFRISSLISTSLLPIDRIRFHFCSPTSPSRALTPSLPAVSVCACSPRKSGNYDAETNLLWPVHIHPQTRRASDPDWRRARGQEGWERSYRGGKLECQRTQ